MTPKSHADRRWHLWCKAEVALRDAADLMQHIGNVVSDARVAELPRHQVAKIRRDLRRFEENFSMLVHEQRRALKRKAVR